MVRKVTINIPEELYKKLESSSEENTRTVTQEVLHCIKIGLEGVRMAGRYKSFLNLGNEDLSDVAIPVKIKSAKKGVKELPSQEEDGFKSYFKEKRK